MSRQGKRQTTKDNRGKVRAFLRSVSFVCLGPLTLGLLSGCQSLGNFDWPWEKVELPPVYEENYVYRGGNWEREPPPTPGTLAGDFAAARILFQQAAAADAEAQVAEQRGAPEEAKAKRTEAQRKYADAEKVFRQLGKKAVKDKNETMIEDCLFMEAECQYAQREFRNAVENYRKLLENYPSSKYRNEVVQREYAIAEYWLDDTRREMEAWKEYEEGKRWFVIPSIFHFEKDKPFIDQEGHAITTCEAVFQHDPAGPLAPKALFLAGGVNYYREDYGDADMYYSLLVDQYPKSPLAPKALELAIQAKINLTGGPDYDGRKLAEARQLIDAALRSYPELRDKQDMLERTLIRINEEQAEKDYRVAELYRRMGHPGSAYFCYEIVRRRYPGTVWAQKATERMLEIRAKVEKENARTEP